MTITHKLKMDLAHQGITPKIDAVQGDINSRVLQIALFAAGVAWEIPADVTVSMRYGKPDGTKGIYDALPDGSSAWSTDGNVISMALAPQMLTVAGSVCAQIVMIRDTDLLATFALQINVARDPSAGSLKSEDYINWLQAYLKDEISEVFQAAKEAGELTGPQGEPGVTPRFTAVTVETLEPGEEATAAISGTTSNLTLALGIPKGAQGEIGPRGIQGPAGGAVKPVFFISGADGSLCCRESGYAATLEEVVDAYLTGSAYFLIPENTVPHKIGGFTISEGGTYGHVMVDITISDRCFQYYIPGSTKDSFDAAMAAYLP